MILKLREKSLLHSDIYTNINLKFNLFNDCEFVCALRLFDKFKVYFKIKNVRK